MVACGIIIFLFYCFYVSYCYLYITVDFGLKFNFGFNWFKPSLNPNLGLKYGFSLKLKPNAFSVYVYMLIRFWTKLWCKNMFKT